LKREAALAAARSK